jgi:hypothetical protein
VPKARTPEQPGARRSAAPSRSGQCANASELNRINRLQINSLAVLEASQCAAHDTGLSCQGAAQREGLLGCSVDLRTEKNVVVA